MRKKIFEAVIIFTSLFLLGMIFIKQQVISSSIVYALNIWVNKLLPTLFPFFIISDILINYNITLYIPKSFRKICKWLFNISDNMLTIFLLSMISGFPSNARNTRNMYDNGMITLEEANHILIFSHFANPAFILSTIAIFFNDKEMATLLMVSHYVSNFILGIIFRKSIKCNNYDNKFKNNDNFGEVLISAVKKAIDTSLIICGILGIFLMISSVIISIFTVSDYNAAIIKGILEITAGMDALSKLEISKIYKLVLASSFLSFGGLSVHIQVLSQIAGTKIRYHYFFIGRMYQMIIAGLITYLLWLIWY